MSNLALAKTLTFDKEQQAMIRSTYASGASESDFQVLMAIAQARALNPLLGQVHFVQRWNGSQKRNVWSTQVSIDGLRAIAQRTGNYGGQDEPEFTDDEHGRPIKCAVRVYRKDWDRPAVGVAYFAEYVQKTKDGDPTKFWRDMPHVMIAKVAEALAIRKAFPEDTSGLYTGDEMAQAENPAPIDVPVFEEISASCAELLAELEAGEGEMRSDFVSEVNSRVSDLRELKLIRDAWKKRFPQ